MKKLFLLISMLLSLTVYAQNEALIPEEESTARLIKAGNHKSHINLEFASSSNAYFTEGAFDEFSFKINRVRLEILGRINDHLSYHFRQSFNKYTNPHTVDNLSSSIEYANLKWHHSDRFDLVAGKQFLALGGYEGYLNALKVREFCEFNNNVDIYQTGVMGSFKITPTQHLTLQLTNNRSGDDNDVLIYGLPDGVESSKIPLLATLNWNGWFADKTVHLMYSASAGQLAKGKNIYYLMCGNIYEKGPVIAYVDVLYARSGLDAQQRITTLQSQGRGRLPVTAQNTQYLTFIADFDYQFHPKWNAYVKGAYETASVYEANDIFNKGRYLTSWNAQVCIEWFPISDDKNLKIFAHYVYKGHKLSANAESLMASMPHIQRASIGLVYVIPVL